MNTTTRSTVKVLVLLIIVAALTAAVSIFWYKEQQPDIDVITRDGVLQRIQHLNNLETVGFHIDTVVTSNREGTWNKLWQDEQKGLFVVSGRVVAGLNLSKLNRQHVTVSDDAKTIHIELPAVEILSSSLDKTEIYDIKTGLFGFMDIDPELLTEAQHLARQQLIRTACNSGILTIANENAQKQVESLFTLTQAQVTVKSAPVPYCGS